MKVTDQSVWRLSSLSILLYLLLSVTVHADDSLLFVTSKDTPLQSIPDTGIPFIISSEGDDIAIPDESSEEDWQGIRSDFYYLTGYQIFGSALLLALPESISGWSKEDKNDIGFEKWKYNVQHIVRDDDHWFVNYVTHPYWGAAYYIRARERGLDKIESFMISALFSTAFEFGIEAFMEEPSIQDFIITPVVGSLIGLCFDNIRQKIKNKSEPLSATDSVILAVTDPLGTFNGLVKNLFRIDSTKDNQITVGFSFRQPVMHLDNSVENTIPISQKPLLTLSFNYKW